MQDLEPHSNESLYSQYLLEREGKQLLEREHGFATYKVAGEECYIVDIFVAYSHRKTGLASAMADSIAETAKGLGCKYLTGSVCPQAKGSTESLAVLLAYGFRLHRADNNLIWFVKEI